MRTTNGIAILVSENLLITSAAMFMTHTARAAAGRTVNQVNLLKGDAQLSY
jgi:hypothetical protein